MSMDNKFTANENFIMESTFKAAFLRASDILDWITEDDVLEKQAKLLRSGMSLEKVAKLDRARLGSAYLRTCAQGKIPKDLKLETK